MRTQLFFVTVALALCPVAPASTQPIGWQKYVVAETGANIDFPNQIFSQDAGRPDRGYGRRFQTSDSRANLTVNSITNDEKDSPASFLRKHFKLPRSAAVYRRVTGNFFAVSGFHDKNIWYNRCNFSGPFIHCVLLNYPANEKRQWDYVVTQISNTLASPRGTLDSSASKLLPHPVQKVLAVCTGDDDHPNRLDATLYERRIDAGSD